MVTPSGLAESESRSNPPNTASNATLVSPVHRLAYTINGGSKSTWACSQRAVPGNAASQNTARNAAIKIKNVRNGFIGDCSWQQHLHFLQRAEVDLKLDARFGVKTVGHQA